MVKCLPEVSTRLESTSLGPLYEAVGTADALQPEVRHNRTGAFCALTRCPIPHEKMHLNSVRCQAGAAVYGVQEGAGGRRLEAAQSGPRARLPALQPRQCVLPRPRSRACPSLPFTFITLGPLNFTSLTLLHDSLHDTTVYCPPGVCASHMPVPLNSHQSACYAEKAGYFHGRHAGTAYWCAWGSIGCWVCDCRRGWISCIYC